jgi:hypothetical protein
MPRFELPPHLSSEEERAVLAALEHYLERASVRPSPWSLAGRAEGLGLGALQVRNQSRHPWTGTRLNHYTRRGVESRMGRGDAK